MSFPTCIKSFLTFKDKKEKITADNDGREPDSRKTDEGKVSDDEASHRGAGENVDSDTPIPEEYYQGSSPSAQVWPLIQIFAPQFNLGILPPGTSAPGPAM